MTLIAKLIQAHTDHILSGKSIPPSRPCSRCHSASSTFTEHDCRNRKFRYIVEGIVYIIESYLLRWKCSLCRSTFTEYPDFAVPYKRYTLVDIMRLSKKYLDDKAQTYRQAVLFQGLRIGYESPKADDDNRLMERTTVWRWVGFLGTVNNTVELAMDIILRKLPDTTIHRVHIQIPTRKYRSPHRKIVLQRGKILLCIIEKFEAIFGTDSFPRFATGNSWT